MNRFIKRLWNNVWELSVMFIGWIIIFIAKIPITFLTIFIITIIGYIIGGVISFIIWQSNKGKKYSFIKLSVALL